MNYKNDRYYRLTSILIYSQLANPKISNINLQVTAQFDAVVDENAQMRKTIDNTVKNNIRVMKRCQEYENISLRNKSEIDDLVDQATNAYDQR
jgi:hypothetical protein